VLWKRGRRGFTASQRSEPRVLRVISIYIIISTSYYRRLLWPRFTFTGRTVDTQKVFGHQLVALQLAAMKSYGALLMARSWLTSFRSFLLRGLQVRDFTWPEVARSLSLKRYLGDVKTWITRYEMRATRLHLNCK